MATSQAQKIIQFESFNYFDEALFAKLGSQGGGNPLIQIANYCKKNSLTTLTEGQASSALGTTIEYAKSRLLELASLNFLNYNTFEKTITPLPKLFSFQNQKQQKKILITWHLSVILPKGNHLSPKRRWHKIPN